MCPKCSLCESLGLAIAEHRFRVKKGQIEATSASPMQGFLPLFAAFYMKREFPHLEIDIELELVVQETCIALSNSDLHSATLGIRYLSLALNDDCDSNYLLFHQQAVTFLEVVESLN